MHEKEAHKSLLGTSGDGSQAGDQGRRSIAEAPQLVFQLHGGSTLSTFAAVVVAPQVLSFSCGIISGRPQIALAAAPPSLT